MLLIGRLRVKVALMVVHKEVHKVTQRAIKPMVVLPIVLLGPGREEAGSVLNTNGFSTTRCLYLLPKERSCMKLLSNIEEVIC